MGWDDMRYDYDTRANYCIISATGRGERHGSGFSVVGHNNLSVVSEWKLCGLCSFPVYLSNTIHVSC